jgi:hypothetical protein
MKIKKFQKIKKFLKQKIPKNLKK